MTHFIRRLQELSYKGLQIKPNEVALQLIKLQVQVCVVITKDTRELLYKVLMFVCII